MISTFPRGKEAHCLRNWLHHLPSFVVVIKHPEKATQERMYLFISYCKIQSIIAEKSRWQDFEAASPITFSIKSSEE